MLGIHSYWLFVLAGIALNLTPGQDTLFIIGRSLTGGARTGIAAALGISVGSLLHTLAAALGLSVILATSELAFSIVKIAGAAYLIVLGVALLRTKRATAKEIAEVAAATTQPRSAFLQGIITNVLNPKVALFFLAFLPQFIEPGSAHKPLAFLALGATFIFTGLLWCFVLALGAARLQGFFLRRPTVKTWIDRAVGGLFVALGARLVLTR